jgi:hypothetical protein
VYILQGKSELKRLSGSLKLRFCIEQAPSDALIISKNGEKEFLSYTSDEIPFKDDRLNIYFEDATGQEDTLLLLRFNCPDHSCDYVASNWTDLRAHTRSEHGTFFCELCIKYSRIFAHEHTLHTTAGLKAHLRGEHKHCDFCNLNFYSSDELYIHMRDAHEQCFICKRHEERSDEYQRNYDMLEKHFKKDHFLCESKECLEKKFVVFESELDFKAHQVAEHGTELSSREKRDALRVTANFHFDASSSAARGGATAGTSGYTARGKPKKEEEPETKRDVLGRSQLASRSHVPGAGGAADHQSRKAQFGATLTTGDKGKAKGSKEGGGASDAEASRIAQEQVRRHQKYMDQVYAILINSDSKMQSFRANVKVYRAGETSSRDLIDSFVSLIGDLGQVDLIEEHDKKEDVLTAWNTLRLERTQFPSLVPASLAASGASNAAKGQIRNAKSTASANINNRIWENVERAAASGRGYGGMVPASNTRTTRDHFPSLGSAKSATASVVPGSARHSAIAHASARGTAWAGSSVSKPSASNALQPGGTSTPTYQHPYTVEVNRDPERSNRTSIRSHPTSFPALPANTSAANLAAYKRSLFESKQASNSGSSTPKLAHAWGSSLGRIDGGEDVNADVLQQRLQQQAQIQDRKKAKQKNVVVTLGTIRRG